MDDRPCVARRSLPANSLPGCTAEEQARAVRYKIAKAREQFVIGRWTAPRGLLSDYLGVAPNAVPLAYMPSGKPILGERYGLHFNVTHTDWHRVVLAVGRRRVGVDVERVRAVGRRGGPGQPVLFTGGRGRISLPAGTRPPDRVLPRVDVQGG